MAKKTNFGPDFGPFWPKFGPQNFFSWILSLLDVILCCKLFYAFIDFIQFQGKLMNQT